MKYYVNRPDGREDGVGTVTIRGKALLVVGEVRKEIVEVDVPLRTDQF